MAVQGTPSGPREMFPEKRLCLDVLIINQQIKRFF